MRRIFAILNTLAAGVLVALATTSAVAGTIEIDLTGLNLNFAGGQIYDADHLAGGGNSIANATALGSIVFSENGTYVGALDSNVYADILVNNVPRAAGRWFGADEFRRIVLQSADFQRHALGPAFRQPSKWTTPATAPNPNSSRWGGRRRARSPKISRSA